MFFVRGGQRADLPAIVEIAQHLDSVNLPNDEEKLLQIIDRSERSFAGRLDSTKREFLFVIAERIAPGPNAGDERVVGASMIFASHGSRQAPHVFFDVIDEERYSETLDRHFRHTVLRIGYNYRGLTEVGGLVMLPTFRGHPERLGRLLAYVRFLYIGLHRDLFREEVVAELMPPLGSDGTSLLWESLGRRFTGLSYQEADRLSRENKEFIRSLFPQDPLYATLMAKEAQALIGQVGPATQAVERMLRRLGFSYAHRIDPFDGGPHFHAKTDEIPLVKGTRRSTLLNVSAAEPDWPEVLVGVELEGPPFFRGVRTRARLASAGVVLPPAAAEVLGITAGGTLGITPLSMQGG